MPGTGALRDGLELSLKHSPSVTQEEQSQTPPSLRSVGLFVLLRAVTYACRGCPTVLETGAGKAQTSSILGSVTSTLSHLISLVWLEEM